jgi:major membrane immunogen (membrane-anchored lipoprotein)
MYGSFKVSQNGKTVTWLYDYKNDKPRLKSEMTQEEINESEKAKYQMIKNSLKK